ncbi:hypothetical protein [Dyella acidisoli]|uniref:Uncharacterized protein n=1 Tax=Dyella acidisoli TaxID=1867834 RepID=A0ABQ5XQK4_9GAMM|nr:hypothetical protein [Dyella acidisoli]GLQ94030.1 hypothetical protein GCM10007901_29810 [Dyella acidisoli]
MVVFDDVVDFHIVLAQFASIEHANWLIYAKPASRCLAVHGDLASAMAHALQMAEYRISAGKAAQIHVKKEDGKSWQTVWCSEGCAPKYA